MPIMQLRRPPKRPLLAHSRLSQSRILRCTAFGAVFASVALGTFITFQSRIESTMLSQIEKAFLLEYGDPVIKLMLQRNHHRKTRNTVEQPLPESLCTKEI
ncbi:hypothetical protein BDQ17DRAFT_1434213 [Cyathus striatus]|nr:hypothetical protein BDQ17DRAFT_1434213 [Cyathus striatus]